MGLTFASLFSLLTTEVWFSSLLPSKKETVLFNRVQVKFLRLLRFKNGLQTHSTPNSETKCNFKRECAVNLRYKNENLPW